MEEGNLHSSSVCIHIPFAWKDLEPLGCIQEDRDDDEKKERDVKKKRKRGSHINDMFF